MFNKTIRIAFLAGMSVMEFMPSLLHANSSDTAASDPSTYAQLDEVIVTAQKRNERLQDVPIAIAAMTGESLAQLGVRSVQDLSQMTPSLTITNDSGYMLPRIRGIGNNVIGAGYESGVATYVDGVYIASLPASLLTLSSVERVEVVEGPQGTLFGRNSTGGLIQVITKEPTHELGGTISFGYGDYRTASLDEYVTGGLSESVAADLSTHAEFQGQGYGINNFNGDQVNQLDQDIAVRGSVLFTPSADTKLRLIADYEDRRGTLYSSFRLAPGTSAFAPQGPIGSAWDIDADFQPFDRFHGYGFSARLQQDLGIATLTGTTAYRGSDNTVGFDADATPAPALNLVIAQRDRQFSQEVQVASRDSAIQWIAGAYYFYGTSQYDPASAQFLGFFQQPTPFGPLEQSNTFAQLKTSAPAIFAQTTLPLGENSHATLGARYTTEHHDIEANQTVVFAGNPAAIAAAPIPSQSARFSSPTWRLAFDRRFDPGLMAYISYDRGFKSGGFNGQLPEDPAFKPEHLDAAEVGLKADFLNQHLRFNSSAFYYWYKDIQVGKFTGEQISYYNGAAAKVYGIEGEMTAVIGNHLSVEAGATWLHDRFTDFPNAIISEQVPGGIDATMGSAAGNRLPNTADFVSTVTLHYHASIGVSETGVDLSWNFNDGYYTQPDNILRQPAFNRINGALWWKLPHDLTIKTWANNLSNAKVANTLDAGSFNSIASFAPPRTFGVTLSAKF